ncbi:MAG TPA: hypothetical protein VJC05_02235 [Candidatus Andersenbacteria bacterium]|nr:hypothetical protein [Candidatus Andersenbacteria bacterium]
MRDSRAALDLTWRSVIGSDATGERVAFCPPEMLSRISVVPAGQVAGIFSAKEAQAQDPPTSFKFTPEELALVPLLLKIPLPPEGANQDAYLVQIIQEAYPGVTKEQAEQQVKVARELEARIKAAGLTKEKVHGVYVQEGIWASIKALPGRILAGVGTAADTALSTLFQILGSIAGWLLTTIIKGMVVPLLTIGQFVGSPVVAALWPTVLTLANAGFLLALMLIALLTTLRVESGGARRMLPRLLVAALLVNFSLVIAGVIIDFSRLLMAALEVVILGANVENLGDYLSANLIDSVFYQNEVTPKGLVRKALPELIAEAAETNGIYLHQTVGYGVGMIVLWIAVLGSLVLAFQLIIRWLALLLLVIISPLAYLFIAFPNTGNLAKKWWSMFLHYVFFAPVVLFLLLGVVKLGGVSFLQNATDNLWSLITKPILIGAAFYAAAKAGTFAGVAGSAAAMSLATRSGRRAIRGGIGGAATVTGTRALGRYGRDYARGYGGQLRKNVLSRLGFSTTDPKLAGQRRAERTFLSRSDKQMAREATAVARRPGGVAGHLNDPALSGARLGSGAVARSLLQAPGGFQNIRDVFRGGSVNQVRRLARNKDLMAELSDEQQLQIQADVTVNPHVGALNASDQSKILEDIQETADKASKAEEGKK